MSTPVRVGIRANAARREPLDARRFRVLRRSDESESGTPRVLPCFRCGLEWPGMHLHQIGQDVRHSLRTLRAMPLVSAVVILSLGVGIGVNTTVFSWVQLFTLNPLPGVRDGGRFELVEPRTESGGYPGTSWREYGDLKERLTAFQDLLAFRMLAVNVGERAQTERTYALLVSGNYFSALGLTPTVGRFLAPHETSSPGGEPVAVISHEYWQTRLGGTQDVLARTLRINDRDLTIIGVAPAGFQGTVLGLQFAIWMPAT